MTGKRLYAYLLAAAPFSRELCASLPSDSAGFLVKDVEIDDKIRIICEKIMPGRQVQKPLTAGRLFKKLSAALDDDAIDKDVVLKDAISRWTAAALDSVSDVRYYRKRALCLNAKKRTAR